MDKAMRAATGHVEGNARPRLGGAMSRIYVAISNAARDPIGLRAPRGTRSAAGCFMPGTGQSRCSTHVRIPGGSAFCQRGTAAPRRRS